MSTGPVFSCPSCGARLQAKGDAVQVACDYCGNHVTVPEGLRPARPAPAAPAPPVVVIQHSSSAAPAPPARAGGACVGVFIVLILGLVAAGAATWLVFERTTSTIVSTIPTMITIDERFSLETTVVSVPPTTGLPPATPTPAYAGVALRFGEEGTGAGHFDDLRSIAVDGRGNIYTGEYSSGRIQKFDPQGQFLTTWQPPGRNPLRGLAADRAGHVYVVRQGVILKYDGATGELLRTFDNAEYGYDDVTMRADGTLLAVDSSAASTDIVHLDADGNLLSRIANPIANQTERPELNMRVAVDGLGTIFALGSFNNAIFKFTPEGKFVTRIGSEGDAPGQFWPLALFAIAVDNQSRVYASDVKGIQVFDAEGRYLGLIEVEGSASGIVINDQNDIFVAARSQVLKYVLTPRP